MDVLALSKSSSLPFSSPTDISTSFSIAAPAPIPIMSFLESAICILTYEPAPTGTSVESPSFIFFRPSRVLKARVTSLIAARTISSLDCKAPIDPSKMRISVASCLTRSSSFGWEDTDCYPLACADASSRTLWTFAIVISNLRARCLLPISE